LDLSWPVDLPTALITEFAVKEDLSLTVLAEESLLLLEFFGHGDTVGPPCGPTRKGSDMLLYAALDSKSVSFRGDLTQHRSKKATDSWIRG
jgi:hypothetical protein